MQNTIVFLLGEIVTPTNEHGTTNSCFGLEVRSTPKECLEVCLNIPTRRRTMGRKAHLFHFRKGLNKDRSFLAIVSLYKRRYLQFGRVRKKNQRTPASGVMLAMSPHRSQYSQPSC